MTVTAIDLDSVDSRPAQYVLDLIRTYRITRDEQHLDQIADYLNRTTSAGPDMDEDGAIALAVHVVLGAGLDYAEMVRALRLPTTPNGGHAGQDAGLSGDERIRAEMCNLTAQAA